MSSLRKDKNLRRILNRNGIDTGIDHDNEKTYYVGPNAIPQF